MNLPISIFLIVAGIVLLAKGADWLVHGGASLAKRAGVSSLVIGLTVVAFGTSTPELATSIIGGGDIAVGNVAGSNLMNLGLILGIVALIRPLTCQGKLLRFEVPLMALLGLVFMLVAWGGVITFLEGALLTLALIAFLAISVVRGRVEKEPLPEAVAPEGELTMGRALFYVVLGVVALSAGGKFLVDGAVWMAEWMGVPERVIALTLVAGGTSLPELATCVAAAKKGEGDMALGNIIGSNIFNILGVLGICALVSPVMVGERFLTLDIPATILIQFLCVPILLVGMRVTRWEGGILLAAYTIYLVVLFDRL